MSFTIFDIVIFIILISSSLHGMYRGIIRLILSSFSFLMSMLLATYIYPFVNELLARHIQSEEMVNVSSTILSYALSSILFSFIMSKLASSLYGMTSSFSDKILGLIGGAIRGSLIAICLFIALACFYSGSYRKAENLDELIVHSLNQNKYPTWLTKSISYEYLYKAAGSIKNNLPKQYFKSIEIHKRKTESDIETNGKQAVNKDELESLYPEDFK